MKRLPMTGYRPGKGNGPRGSLPSYHDRIQIIARKIEKERAKSYTRTVGKIEWSESQMLYLHAIIYKLLRIKNQTRSKEKALDDILDAYNYCALLYEDLTK